jgi:hypothetical protein
MTVRNSDAAAAVGALAAQLRARILDLAQDAGPTGLTSNEAERLITAHKANGVSPRFSELVRHGDLVRVLVGHGPGTKRFPGGVPRYVTRWDGRTERNVIVHWHPNFTPKQPVASAETEMSFRESA